ncbi:MAG: DUF554 domain-containing protein [Bacteroidales bacterium]|jgi:uncharacterized membrane protein YqgA involved in biofilm formation|nr:DUF554 domain-containing protein [Bacteroidales bacterium]
MIGTLINAGAIVAGSGIGLIAHSKMPERISTMTFYAMGLFTLVIGIHMALQTQEIVLMIFSIVLGTIVGEWWDIDKRLNTFAAKFTRNKHAKNDLAIEKTNNGVIGVFLLFCMGSMSILGAIEDGTGQEPKLLMAKAVLDGFSSIAFAATLGWTVILAIIPLILYQGSITLFASFITRYLGASLITELTAVGGLLLIGLALGLLNIKTIRISNMLPSLVFVVIFGLLLQLWRPWTF